MKRSSIAASGLALACLSAPLFAHGTMEVPINRVYACYQEGPEAPKSAACREAQRLGGSAAMYDWNGINQNPPGDKHQAVVPDGQLCAGGQKRFQGFNLPRGDWTATPIAPDADGQFEFVYLASAPHATRYFRFYVTRDGWNPQQALAWADLELFASHDGTPPLRDGRYRIKVKLPPGKQGAHIIYNVWKRSDSEEAFYSCSDVRFVAPLAKTARGESWREAGQLRARAALPAGSSAVLRVFDAQGRDVESHRVALDGIRGQAKAWPYWLAREVNARSRIVRIGEMRVADGQATIEPVADASRNRVYFSDAHPGYRYALDLRQGDGA
ncbi:chitin-binding protein [Xenophilus sp. AP218F]|nr:lytic polysaccharide monooxygenase [Chromobacterium sp. ASV5]OWY38263.1 chitin-binding protein [Xenophilus sp. AP218F]